MRSLITLLRTQNFYPRPPRGGRHFWSDVFGLKPLFLSTPSARRATSHISCLTRRTGNFYPRPPRGGRPVHCIFNLTIDNFYPRPPRGGRRVACTTSAKHKYFYPRPPRGGRRRRLRPACHQDHISIHALREEGDFRGAHPDFCAKKFLSTPSARRATHGHELLDDTHLISIHALREEGDGESAKKLVGFLVFLSTPSARRATIWQSSEDRLILYFYPRPPRGGRRLIQRIPCPINHFYPRPPRGGRPGWGLTFDAVNEFLSTPSARRATGQGVDLTLQGVISIHALREEGDKPFLARPFLRR